MPENQYELLISKAKKARNLAQARYSKFKVGAALLTDNNDIFTGCNVESSSYGLTICAERVALTKALSEGATSFLAIAIFAKDGYICPPCGACRQLLYDYAPDIDVILSDGSEHQIIKLKDLLPFAFDDSQIGK
ncbi:MAG TPA: cytidine deaminase [Caldithrix sp.]|nr:cytidine deaminase [Calditrichaceae bacterium]HEM49126.1 cytidine deaminase [Caldithrix sp.]HES59665.1 cytidine deaminase [Caldithrix sp.]